MLLMLTETLLSLLRGDNLHGYELWKSNGTTTGTAMIKDINPGVNNSAPFGMFVYKHNVFFGAYNGADDSFWKSDGTNAGTVQVKKIDPFLGARNSFCITNNIVYFAAIDTSNAKGSQVWKTDGTSAGTQVVADINPTATSNYPYPRYFTDVNGTIIFYW